MYTDAKIGICLVGMKVLRKQIRLFGYSGKLDCIRQFKAYTESYLKIGFSKPMRINEISLLSILFYAPSTLVSSVQPVSPFLVARKQQASDIRHSNDVPPCDPPIRHRNVMRRHVPVFVHPG